MQSTQVLRWVQMLINWFSHGLSCNCTLSMSLHRASPHKCCCKAPLHLLGVWAMKRMRPEHVSSWSTESRKLTCWLFCSEALWGPTYLCKGLRTLQIVLLSLSFRGTQDGRAQAFMTQACSLKGIISGLEARFEVCETVTHIHTACVNTNRIM